MNEKNRNDDCGGKTVMPGPWPMLVILVLPFACMIALRFVGLDWLQQTLPSLPVKAANFPVLGTWAFTLAILLRARPAGWADLRRICLFILIVEVAAVLMVLAGSVLLRQSSLDPRSGEFMTIEFVATVGVIFLLCEFLMRLGLLPGCSSWRALRSQQKVEQQLGEEGKS